MKRSFNSHWRKENKEKILKDFKNKEKKDNKSKK